MNGSAKQLRRLRLALALAGVAFLGAGFAATAERWIYQARQERALFRPARIAVPGPAPAAGVAPSAPAPASHELDPLVLGTLEIRRLGIAGIVREGEDDATLALAIGHVPGTAKPGEPGNMVLAAHRDTFFRELRQIEPHDRITFDFPPHHYEYQVVSTRVVNPSQIEVMAPHGIDELTLLTCFPFDFIGSAPQRFVVSAIRIATTPSPSSRSTP